MTNTTATDDVKAAIEYAKSRKAAIQPLPLGIAQGHCRTLAARVEELEAERWKCVGCGAEFPIQPHAEDIEYCAQCATVQAMEGVIDRLEDQLAAAERVIDGAINIANEPFDPFREAEQYRSKFPVTRVPDSQ